MISTQREKVKLWSLGVLLLGSAAFVNYWQGRAGVISFSATKALGDLFSSLGPNTGSSAGTPNYGPLPTAQDQLRRSVPEPVTGNFEVNDYEVNGILVPAGMKVSLAFCEDNPVIAYEFYIDGKKVAEGTNAVGAPNLDITTPSREHTQGWKLKPGQSVRKKQAAYVVYDGPEPERKVWYPIAVRKVQSADAKNDLGSQQRQPTYGVIQINDTKVSGITVQAGMSTCFVPTGKTPLSYEYFIDARYVCTYKADGRCVDRDGKPVNPISNADKEHSEGWRLEPGQAVRENGLAYVVFMGPAPEQKVWYPLALAAGQR